MSITELAVKRPTLVVVFFTIITFFGMIGYNSLTYELLPDISSPVMSISTIYPGASPTEVENSVTRPIEDAVSSLENVEGITAVSQEGFSSVVVELTYGADVDLAVQDAQRKLDAIMATLPDDTEDPTIGKFSLDALPIMQLGATSDMDALAFTELFDQRIQPELARIEGVAQVQLSGGEEREIAVNVDSDKLRYYNLSLLQVSSALAQANLDFPTGSVRDAQRDISVRLSGKIRGLEELRNLIVTTLPNGSRVYMKDVAEVNDTKKDISTISRINGRNSLGVSITKTSDGNTVEVSEQVQKRLRELETEYAASNMKFEIANDSSVFTLEAANAVIHDLLIAIVLVAFIMLLFLHNIRNAIIVMVAIPVSVVATFAVMSLFGFTLNLMTLLALSLVIGILVDDSIVVLENIQARMEKGASSWDAAIGTWDEIGVSVMSITAVIVVVFLPIGLVTGLVADLLRQFSLVVVAATIISLIVSFTLTPWLASRFTKITHLDPDKWYQRPLIWFESLVNGIKNFYGSLLEVALRHKALTLVGIFAMVFASFLLLTQGFIGTEFVASGDNGEFIINVELPKETPLEQTNYVTQEMEEYLLGNPYITNVFTVVGSGGGGGNASSYLAQLNVKLVPAEERPLGSDRFARDTKLELQRRVPGAEITAAATSMVGGANAAPIQISVTGTDLDEMLAFSEMLVGEVAQVPSTSEVKATVEGGNPEISVDIDRDRMGDLGLTLDRVGATMQNAFSGNTDTRFTDGAYDYDVRVQLDAFDRRNQADIEALTFQSNNGDLITLGQFARVNNTVGSARLERKDKISSLTIESQVVGRPVGTVSQEIEERIAQIDTPAGVTVTMGGDLESQNEAFGSLLIALLTSIVLVYLIMVALYDNYVYPFVVMFSIPVALIGAFLALALVMESLSIFGMLGLIMLVGLVVKNAILIVDFANQLKTRGMAPRAAIIEATLERFRPTLMTTIAMVIAMIPIAIATGAGSEWKNGLAWVLIGGLTSSMLLTLIIVPVTYRAVDSAGERWTAWRARRAGGKKEVAVA